MPEADVDIYPDELPKVKDTFQKLQQRFTNTPMLGDSTDQFDRVAAEMFAEIGFRVEIDWFEERTKGGILTGTFVPRIILTERIRPEEETDHSRVQWGVVKGLADGQPGYIREDGSKHEEPRKKPIF